MRILVTLNPTILVALIIGIGVTTDCQSRPTPSVAQAVPNETQLIPIETSSLPSKPSPVPSETRLAPTETLPPTIDELSYTEILPRDIVLEMIGQVDQERVLADLRRLTGVDPICIDDSCYTITGRETESEGLQWAKDYVYQELINLGYSVEVQDWSFEGYNDQNLIARKQGSVYPNEQIYFIAHLDGYLDNNPAADDDASGVVGLIELSRILSNRSLSYTVVIFFSTGEEHGSLGSRFYVDHLTQDEISAIKYLVSVEMIGYDSNNDGAMQLWSGYQPTEFAQILSEIISTYQLGLTPQIVADCT